MTSNEKLIKILLKREDLDLRITDSDGYICFDFHKDIWNDYEIQRLIVLNHPYMLKELKKKIGINQDLFNDEDIDVKINLKAAFIYKDKI